jgi:hypothetical protein
MLRAIVGDTQTVISALLAKAKPLTLIIDCANAANPHKIKIPQEELWNYEVICVELLYALRDITQRLPQKYTTILITPMEVLFNYQNERENIALYSQIWQNLQKSNATIYVGILRGSKHEKYARLYCHEVHMGHTVYSQRVTLNILQMELKNYAKSLSTPDQQLFLEMIKLPSKHIGSITFASSLHAWAFFTLSVALEQQKKIQLLEEAYETLASGHISDKREDYSMDQVQLQERTN